MANSKSQRRGEEVKNRKGKLAERASSFHGGSSLLQNMGERLMIRPRTVPDLLAGRSAVGISIEERPKLTKLLLNVTIQRSIGAVQMLITPESTVSDLIAAALQQYAKEGRRPIFSSPNPTDFDLHYSQFSLESLDRNEMLLTLGSRNFFLCSRKPTPATETDSGGVTTTSWFCSKHSEKTNKIGLPWLKFLSL